MKREMQEKGNSDLIFMLSEKEVPLPVQHAIIMSGVNTMSRFTGLEDDKAAMRKTLIQITKLAPDDNIESNIILSDILAAWDAARDYGKQELALKAAAAASNVNLPLPVPKKDYQIMAAAHKDVRGKTPDAELPGKPLMARCITEFQDDDPEAEPLNDV